MVTLLHCKGTLHNMTLSRLEPLPYQCKLVEGFGHAISPKLNYLHSCFITLQWGLGWVMVTLLHYTIYNRVLVWVIHQGGPPTLIGVGADHVPPQ